MNWHTGHLISKATGLAAALLVFAAFCTLAQVIPSGSLDGEVRDATGALLPGTTVALTNLSTGVAQTIATNEAGTYLFNLVPIGQYRLEAELKGFKKYIQTITIELGRKTTANLRMEVGEVQDTVEVTSDAPTLETSTASLTTNLNNKMVTELPLAGRNALELARLSAGVVTFANPNPSALQDISNTSYYSANGANQRTNEFLMDGVPNNVTDRVAYIPPVDQVQEVSIQTNSFDSEYGHAGGAYINVSTKSGGNQLHGSVYEFHRNSVFNANSFFSNRSGTRRPTLIYNQFGAAVGGALIKNKTFWFGNYEGVRQINPSLTPSIITVPTERQRRGDFSQTLGPNGQLIQIYDPFTTRPDPANPNRFVRDPFPGNVIPQNRLNPAAAAIVDTFVPLPNQPGDPGTGTRNFSKVLVSRQPTDNFTVRMDHVLGASHRIFGRFSRSDTPQGSEYLIPVGGGLNVNDRVQTSIGVGDTITINPTTLLTLNAGFTRWTQRGIQPDYDIATLGFSPSYVAALEQVKVPRLNNTGTPTDMPFIGAIEGSWFEHTMTYAFSANMNQIRGQHNLKWGFQTQVKQNNSKGAGGPAGTFNFNRAFTQGPDPTAVGANIGHGLASFLIGTPASGSVTVNSFNSTQSPYYGFYFQDDLRISPRLTVNLGIRYELNLAATERYNRSVIGWAFDTANPIEAQARANYAASPIPELPVDQFRTIGGLLYATPDNRRYALTDKTDFSPRIGLAYRFTEKTVLRAGYGHFYSYWPAPFVQQSGFSAEPPMLSTIDGITPTNLLSNPFPNGIPQPVGSSQGLLSQLGSSVSLYSQFRHSPYNERWELGIQRELTNDMRVEVNYVGSTAQSLYAGSASGGEMNRQLRFLPDQYLSLGSALNQTVPNPFRGLIPATSPLGAATISKQNLLSAFPHVTGLQIQRETIGRAYYHAAQATATKRFSQGYQFLGTYTFQKQIERHQSGIFGARTALRSPESGTCRWPKPRRDSWEGSLADGRPRVSMSSRAGRRCFCPRESSRQGKTPSSTPTPVPSISGSTSPRLQFSSLSHCGRCHCVRLICWATQSITWTSPCPRIRTFQSATAWSFVGKCSMPSIVRSSVVQT